MTGIRAGGDRALWTGGGVREVEEGVRGVAP